MLLYYNKIAHFRKRGLQMKRLLVLSIAFITAVFMTGCVLSTQNTTQNNTTTQSLTDSSTQTSSSITSDSTQLTQTTLPSITTQTTTLPQSQTTTTTVTYDRYQTIEIFSVNDFHGGAYSNINTLASIGELIKYKKDSTNHTLAIANGDIFQGTSFSNYYQGRPIVDIFNEIGFDAFVIGNHEFDWGIDVIGNYKDGNSSNGEANFEFLAANILTTSNDEMLDFAKPYTIHEINGLKVGIIGVIGDVINSISASRVEGYYFDNVYETVRKYAYELRTQQDVDIVIASIHEYNDYTNYQIASLSGDYLVDAIFNGHTHQSIADSIQRTGTDLPYAQSSNYSQSLLSKITLVYDRETKSVSNAYAENISDSQLSSSDTGVQAIINSYANNSVYLNFVNEVLATTNSTYYRADLSPWGASVIRDYVQVDFGFVNSGGFRVSMPSGTLTMGKMIEIYPFDNFIKTSQLTGQQLNNMCYVLNNYHVIADDSVSCSSGYFYQNGVRVNAQQLYTVAAVDYIFDKTNYGFLQGQNITLTEYLMRDLLVLDLKANTNYYFNPYNGTSYDSYQQTSYTYNSLFHEISFYYQDLFKSIA